jgi:eukaryotic-like serine/threonine-protein kinase
MRSTGEPSPGDDASAWAAALECLPDALSIAPERQLRWVHQQVASAQVRAILLRLLEQRVAMEDANFLGQTAGREFCDDPIGLPDELTAGAVIGRYRLLNMLGRGGMSVVWRAEQHVEAFSRTVALKFPRHAGVGLARRLQREKRILATLEHASIARLYDVGVTPRGLPFIAMEYVAGTPLDVWCRERHLPLDARLALLAQVVEAIQVAHANLILHRDIKPSNILVDDAGQVHLLDFGIAKHLHTDSLESASTELTHEGGAPMTPAYASPEQRRGEPLSVRSDVYALGVLMYEVLTGTLPFGAGTAAARGSDARDELPPLPSRRAAEQTEEPAVRAFARALRGDLDAIILQALEPRLAKRTSSAASVYDDLMRHQRHEPVAAVPPRRLYVLGRFVRRHRVMVSAVGVSLAAMGAGTAIALVQATRAADEAARARAVSGFLVDVFQASSIDTVDAGMARRQTAQELLGHGARRLVAGSLGHGAERRELQGMLSGLLDDLAMTEDALAVRTQWLQELREEKAPPQTKAGVLLDMARTRMRQGEHPRAVALLSESRQVLTGSSGRDTNLLRQQAWVLEGQIALRQGDLAGARQALAELGPTSMPDPRDGSQRKYPEVAWLELQAGVANIEGRTDDAAALLRLTVQEHERTYSQAPARLAIALYGTSSQLWEIGRADEAWSLLGRAYALAQSALGSDHVSTILISQQLGRLLVYRGELSDGLRQLRASADALRRFAGRIEPTALVRSQDYLAEALMANGRHREGLQALDETQSLIRSAGELPFDVSLYHDILRSRVYTDIGRYAEALRVLRQAEAAIIQRLGDQGPAWLDLQTRVLDTLRASGNLQKAWALLEQLERRCAADPGLQAQFGADLRMSRIALLLDQHAARDAQKLMNEDPSMEMQARWQQGDVAARWRYGRLSLQLGRHADAEQAFRTVVTSLSSHGYPDDPAIAEARGYLALALLAQGRAQEAQVLQRQARSSLQQELAGAHFSRPLRGFSDRQPVVAIHQP